MEVIHIAGNKRYRETGYEIVTLIANRVNRTNSLSVIENDGEKSMTGGFILENTSEIRAVLDAIPADKQYEFIKSFRVEPFVKTYYEEEYYNTH